MAPRFGRRHPHARPSWVRLLRPDRRVRLRHGAGVRAPWAVQTRGPAARGRAMVRDKEATLAGAALPAHHGGECRDHGGAVAWHRYMRQLVAAVPFGPVGLMLY